MKKAFIPTRAKQDAKFQLKDFLGVDFSTHESEVANRRSPDSINMISGKAGSMDKRLGYAIEHLFDGKIWAVYQTEYALGNSTFDVIIVQAGTKLWYFDSLNETWTTVKTQLSPYTTELVLQERPTNIIQAPNNAYYKLIHNNWITANTDIIMLMFIVTFAPTTFKVAYTNITTEGDTYSRIVTPTTSIGRTPAGIGTLFESANLLSNRRKNAFLSDASATQYFLDASSLNAVVTVTQMQSNGAFSTALHDVSNNVITYTVDTINRKITFSAIPHATYKAGVDNIIVTFDTSSTVYSGYHMNVFSSFAQYGLGGRNDYVFICNGFSTFSNMERWFKFDENGLYLGENNYSRLGNNRKIGYSKLGQYLVLHGDKLNNEDTIFLKIAGLDNQGEVTFSNTPSKSNVGALSSQSFANLRDDALWLSEGGINSLVTNEVTNIQSVQDRGFYINKQLLEETNLDKAYAFIYDNKYFICVNSHVYIADPRSKYTERLAYSESFQYDWYYLDGIDIQSYFVFDNILHFGTTDGRLCRLKLETDEHAYEDEIIGTETTWANATNYVVGQLVKDSGTPTKYYICLKAHTSDLTVRSLTNETYWNEITKGTDRFYVPIIAYWTTPIMNMNNITAKKTLRNLWVRLPKYAFTGVRIYYSSKGLVKKQYDGIFDFSTLDFSRLSFSTDTDPMVVVTNTKQSKFMSIQFKIESRDNTPMSLLEIVGEYTTNGKFKG